MRDILNASKLDIKVRGTDRIICLEWTRKNAIIYPAPTPEDKDVDLDYVDESRFKARTSITCESHRLTKLWPGVRRSGPPKQEVYWPVYVIHMGETQTMLPSTCSPRT